MIRKTLKQNGIKAKVTSESASMMTAVRVRIEQDVLPAARAEIKAYCDQFQYGHFDGMVDLYEYTNRRDDLPQVKYVSVDFEHSDEIKQAAADFLASTYGIEADVHSSEVYRVLTGADDCGFWTAYKPRVAA